LYRFVDLFFYGLFIFFMLDFYIDVLMIIFC